ncbi:MAG: adenine phosphoribosyltransferase [Acidobacteriota bacterium]|nr:adenine phosphoribosyltransferase [Acidobacteriota bacterium]
MEIDLKTLICDVPDFPKPGIIFKDITPVVQNAAAFNQVIDRISAWAKTKKPQMIAGIESRGFLFAAPVARDLGLGMAIIRKKGKLPRKAVTIVAPNEYAVEHFEMHEDSILPGQRVLIVDDLIATGSSSTSAVNLVRKLKGEVVGFATVVDLSFLRGIEHIKKECPWLDILSLVTF